MAPSTLAAEDAPAVCSQCDALQLEVQQLRRQLAAQAECVVLQGDCRECIEKDKAHRLLEAAVEDLRQDLAHLPGSLSQNETSVGATADKDAEPVLLRDHPTAAAEVEDLVVSLRRATESEQQLKVDLEELQGRLNDGLSTQQKLEAAEGELYAREAEIDALQLVAAEQGSASAHKLEEYKQTVDDLQSQLDTLKSDLTDKDELVGELQQHLQGSRDSYWVHTASSYKKLHQLSEQLLEADKMQVQLQGLIQELQTKLGKCHEEAAEQGQQIKQLLGESAELDRYRHELEVMQVELYANEAEIDALSKQLQDAQLTSSMSNCHDVVAGLAAAENDAMNRDLLRAEDQEDIISNSISTLNATAKQVQNALTNLGPLDPTTQVAPTPPDKVICRTLKQNEATEDQSPRVVAALMVLATIPPGAYISELPVDGNSDLAAMQYISRRLLCKSGMAYPQPQLPTHVGASSPTRHSAPMAGSRNHLIGQLRRQSLSNSDIPLASSPAAAM